MARFILRAVVGGAVVLVLLGWLFSYQLEESRSAVVTRFGYPRRVEIEPGLHAKWPWPVEKAQSLDMRQRLYNLRHCQTLTRDKKNVILMSYVVWRIDDPLRFLQRTTGMTDQAELKLDSLINSAQTAVMGKYELAALVSTNADEQKIRQVEKDILADANKDVKQLGMELLQVGFRRISFPEDNVRYIFDQMRAERAQFAAKALAEGKREAAAIQAETAVKRSTIESEARIEADRIRAEGEAEAARLYAEAQRKDPEFYEFLRSLDSLKKLMRSNATLIMRTDSPPFSVLRYGIKQAAPERKDTQ